jgi:hypothetical protein
VSAITAPSARSPLAVAGALGLAGCKGMDADTGGRTAGGAAPGALAGGTSGVICDQYRKGEGQ